MSCRRLLLNNLPCIIHYNISSAESAAGHKIVQLISNMFIRNFGSFHICLSEISDHFIFVYQKFRIISFLFIRNFGSFHICLFIFYQKFHICLSEILDHFNFVYQKFRPIWISLTFFYVFYFSSNYTVDWISLCRL